jgi:Fe-S cluster biogenesis protein NfuA
MPGDQGVIVEPSGASEFRQRIERIEVLIRAIEQSADPTARAGAQELVQAVLELHGAGFARVLERLGEAGPPGRSLLDAMARDDLVGSLLLLHGLHPLDLETRVQQALDSVRPFLRSHGGEVALLGVADGVVRLRLQGSCQGCPSSAETLKNRIEEAIVSAAPDAAAIEVEGADQPPAGFIPVERLLGGMGSVNGLIPPEPDGHGQVMMGPPR